jgi:holo-[acyl-carrier protein] synthase
MIVGVGVDVVDVARLAAALERTPGLLDRLFSPAEAAVGEPARLAARLAAKEAAAKAIGLGGVRFREVEVVSGGGRPSLLLSGETADAARAAGAERWHVSLSHDGGVATAFVVAEAAR